MQLIFLCPTPVLRCLKSIDALFALWPLPLLSPFPLVDCQSPIDDSFPNNLVIAFLYYSTTTHLPPSSSPFLCLACFLLYPPHKLPPSSSSLTKATGVCCLPQIPLFCVRKLQACSSPFFQLRCVLWSAEFVLVVIAECSVFTPCQVLGRRPGNSVPTIFFSFFFGSKSFYCTTVFPFWVYIMGDSFSLPRQ